MYKKGGTTSKKMGGKRGAKKKMMGGQQTMANPPAASFIEPGVEQPFGQQGVAQQNPAEFTAKKGGVKKKLLGGRSEEMKKLRADQKKMRKEEREKRRADRKADRSAVKTLKKTSRKTRKAKPFEDGAGPIVEMSRAERRADRRATNKASRTFKKQERKARRTSRKDMKAGMKGARQEQRGQDRIGRQEAVNDKLTKLNNSPSSSTNTTVTKKAEGPTNKPVKKTTTKKESLDDLSFSKAFRQSRNAHGGDGGVFTWKGKKYNTNLKKDDKKKTTKKKSNPNDITGKNKNTLRNTKPPLDANGNEREMPKVDPKNPMGIQRRGGYKRRGGKK
tara:strand:+ start:4661 stop:5656 length:996 start_codon:yes stop_codon:yes gene_type:complete